MPISTEIGLGPDGIVLDGDPAPPSKGAQQPPLFGPCLSTAKRSPISATAEFCQRTESIQEACSVN